MWLQIIVTLDLKEGTLKFSHGGRSIGTIAGVKGPLHAAVTLTSSRQKVCCWPPTDWYCPLQVAQNYCAGVVQVLQLGTHLARCKVPYIV
jgi:hypothetical protein